MVTKLFEKWSQKIFLLAARASQLKSGDGPGDEVGLIVGMTKRVASRELFRNARVLDLVSIHTIHISIDR